MLQKGLFLATAALCGPSLERECPDSDLANQCLGDCEVELGSCLSACSDSNCQSACIREHTICSNHCPCGPECPNGCEGCDHPVCVTNETIFAIHTVKQGSPWSHLIQYSGEKQATDFTFAENASAYHACSVVFDGDFYVFGGGANYELGGGMNQMSKVVDCQLKRLSSLPFDFDEGSCGVFNIWQTMAAEKRFLLCFGASAGLSDRECKSFTLAGDFHDEPSSNYGHNGVTMTAIGNKALIVGGRPHGGGNNQAETKTMGSNDPWTVQNPYPYCPEYKGYGSAYSGGVVYFAGGFCDPPNSDTDLIAMYDVNANRWSRAGHLQQRRFGLRSIISGNKMFVVGGHGNLKTEIYEVDDERKRVTFDKIVEPTLKYHETYPEVFVVNSTYCIAN